jgi:hypothetical protein
MEFSKHQLKSVDMQEKMNDLKNFDLTEVFGKVIF